MAKQQLKTYVLAIDCKTDGIRGLCFWIGAVRMNLRDPKEEKAYFNGLVDPYLDCYCPLTDKYAVETIVPCAKMCMRLADTDKRCPVVYHSYDAMWTAFWDFYASHIDECNVVHDCPFLAVENLFITSMSLDQRAREAQCPVRMFNIASMLIMEGESEFTPRDEFLAKHKFSLIQNDWRQPAVYPVSVAFTTLSLFLCLIKH